jgi:hypothetical protein
MELEKLLVTHLVIVDKSPPLDPTLREINPVQTASHHILLRSMLILSSGRAMAQAVSHRPLTAEAPCEICGGQSRIGTSFSLSSSVSPVSIIPPLLYIVQFREIDMNTTELRGRVVDTPASYSGGPEFKYWPGHRRLLTEVFHGSSVPAGG